MAVNRPIALGACLVALVVASSIVLANAGASPPGRACPEGSTVVVIGDSITEIAAPQLRVRLEDAGYRPVINARGGRTIAQGAEVAWGAGEDVSQYGLRCWVLALGTNNLFDGNTDPYTDWIDILTVLGFIPCLPRGCEPTWWVPVRAAGGGAINALIPTNVPQVTAWQPGAEHLQADGVHPNLAGAAVWVDAVLAELTADG